MREKIEVHFRWSDPDRVAKDEDLRQLHAYRGVRELSRNSFDIINETS